MANKKDKSKTMPPSPPKTFAWQVHGVCQPKASQPTNDLISIQEEVSNLRWKNVNRTTRPKPVTSPVTNEAFGRPIDVNKAIELIGSGYSQVKEHFVGLDKDKDQVLDILRLSYGITFDKSLILKILGQPNCEGLRSYLCYRADKKHYSLVMVGVDKNGYDLNYYLDNSEEVKDALASQYDNQGLLVEYGHPPGKVDFEKNDIDEHYVILRYCNPPKKP